MQPTCLLRNVRHQDITLPIEFKAERHITHPVFKTLYLVICRMHTHTHNGICNIIHKWVVQILLHKIMNHILCMLYIIIALVLFA